MRAKPEEKLRRLVAELDSIALHAAELEKRYSGQIALLHPDHAAGGRNLLHYLALRQRDLRDLQFQLASLGLSSLGRSESHVLESVCAVRGALQRLLGDAAEEVGAAPTLRDGRRRIRRGTEALFGRKRRGSTVRIMVTMPEEAADDYRLVHGMVRAGMNCARINCAHLGPPEWERMIGHVHRARASLGRGCKVFMDLSGPKIRTGALVPGPPVVEVDPKRDERGRVRKPVVLTLVPDGVGGEDSGGVRIPVSGEVVRRARPGDRLTLADARDARVSLDVRAAGDGSIEALCSCRAFFETGLPVVLTGPDGRPRAEGEVGALREVRAGIRLREGDTLIVHKDPAPGEERRPASDPRGPAPAHVPCALPQVLDAVERGHEIVLDDGKFRGVVRDVRSGEIVVEITEAQPGGGKLRAFKGINLPDTPLGLFGLTEKDRADLRFVAEHADGVNVSFVNHPDDVEDLIDELEAAGAGELGLVLKIETLMGVRHLPGILLAAMEWPRLGVMIARGDLAAEVGWTRLARYQEEILWLCEAAHVPVVWATEVLNQLAKKGVPTRGEISDVVMAERAECVMLNKGPHITKAIRTLDEILASMQAYQSKKTALLPTLTLETPDPEEIGRPIGSRQGRWR